MCIRTQTATSSNLLGDHGKNRSWRQLWKALCCMVFATESLPAGPADWKHCNTAVAARETNRPADGLRLGYEMLACFQRRSERLTTAADSDLSRRW